MPIKVSEAMKGEGFSRAREVSVQAEKVQAGLKRFRERIERNRQLESPRYSTPSETTRFRVLEM